MIRLAFTRLAPTALAGIVLAALTAPAAAETVVRIGMTAADIPRTLGQPDQGFEGNRFTGNTMYEGLTSWDLSSADKASVVIPGLATEWAVDPDDKTKWIFKLRPGVKFHDGSDFDADAVVWNVEKVLKQDARAFRRRARSASPPRACRTLRSARKIDDMTVELTTAAPDALLPINLTNLLHGEPGALEEALRRGAGERDRSEGTRQAGLGCVLPQCLGHRAVEDGQVRAARAARARQERRLLGRGKRRAEGRSAGAAADARGERPHGGAAVRPGRLDRESGAGRAAADQAARLRRSIRTSSRMSGRGSSAASKARPGTTSACARRPTSASTAMP